MKKMHQLQIDNEFKYLIRPLSEKEFQLLEENIISDGCLQPIVIWNNIIIDGHNRYSICCKHNIPFDVFEIVFDSREEAISWICKNQLGRRNITEETRKYLIGRQYESEKIILSKRNALGHNQYTETDTTDEDDAKISGHKTAKRIAADNNLNYGTVQRYGALAKAVEEIREKCPELANKILSGKYKICRSNILALANLSKEALTILNGKIERNNRPFVEYSKTRDIIGTHNNSQNGMQSIKDMPQFDPDAIISELFLTIPSWISSINRVQNQADLFGTTQKGRTKLITELESLKGAIDCLLCKAMEINND